MIVYLARDIPAFVMFCVNGESVMIIDYHSNKSIIGIYNIIDYDNRLIVPAPRHIHKAGVTWLGSNYCVAKPRVHSDFRLHL